MILQFWHLKRKTIAFDFRALNDFVLFDPDELSGIIAAAVDFVKDRALRIVIKRRRTREDPKIIRAAAAHKRVGISFVDQHHAVVGVERTEERNAQKRGRVGSLALPDRRL